MTLYELLGVKPEASIDAIKRAHKKAVRENHPDKGGDPEKFREVQEAFEVLSDPERRKRYDSTGRKDKSKITPQRVKNFIDQTMTTLLNARDPMGWRDDPTLNDFREQIIQSLLAARKEIKNMKFETQRKIEKATRMLERFKTSAEFDPVGDSLRDTIKSLEDQLKTHEDAHELSVEVERVMKTYKYDVGPAWEGQDHTGPTTRRGGVLFIR